eukprot:8989572-Pyramimonas_sp.AAC.1
MGSVSISITAKSRPEARVQHFLIQQGVSQKTDLHIATSSNPSHKRTVDFERPSYYKLRPIATTCRFLTLYLLLFSLLHHLLKPRLLTFFDDV